MSDDFSEIMKLSKDLSDVPAEANRRIKSALEFTSINLRDDWRQGAEISGGFPKSYPASISYDLKYPGGAIESEIGPVLGRTPGASAGFLDEPLSSAGVDGPVHHAGRNALEANQPGFVRGLEIAATDALIDKVEKG